MLYASGQPRYTADTIPRALLLLPKPRDLKWDGVHIPSELQRLLDEAGAVWVLRADGTYEIYMLGAGDLPALPAADALPADLRSGRGAGPEILVVTSTPQRAIDQATISGIGELLPGNPGPAWEYVGFETDGSLKPLPELSYVKATGKTPAALIREGLYSVAPAHSRLAATSLFTMVRLSGAARTNYLPILTRTAATTSDAGEVERALPLRVRAKTWYRKGGLYWNAEEMIDVHGVRVDGVNGVLTFPGRLGKLAFSGAPNTWAWFDPLSGPEDLEITFSFESRVHGGPKDYFYQAYRRDASGNIEMVPDDDWLGDPLRDVRVLSVPSLVEYRVHGASRNNLALSTIAYNLADRLLTDPTGAKTYRYKGLHAVEPHGNIESVRWDLRSCTTSFDYRTYFIAASRWLDKKALYQTGRRAAAGAVGAAAAPHNVQAGCREWAPYSAAGPGPAAEAMDFAAAGILSGKVIADWAPADGNTIDVHPCDDAGANVDADRTVTLYAVTPTGTAVTYLGLAAGEVVQYVPYRQDTGFLVGVLHGGTCASPLDATYAGEHAEAARSAAATSWDRANQGAHDGFKLTVVTGNAYYDASDETWYEHRQDITIDSAGMVKAVSAEYRVTVDVPEVCT